jgi:hypothetical protein
MRKFRVAVVWFLIAGAAAYLFLFDPATSAGYLSCPFRALTGLQCPGCGAQRALHQLLHGHPIAALELNPLVMLCLPFLTYGLLWFTKGELTGRQPVRIVVAPKYEWIVLGLVICFWIVRNTPLYPFVS